MARLVATVCSGLLVINIVWMAQTGASYLRDAKEKVANYEIVNECADNITNMPIDKVAAGFDVGVEKADMAAYLTYALLVTYGLSVFFIVRQVKQF